MLCMTRGGGPSCLAGSSRGSVHVSVSFDARIAHSQVSKDIDAFHFCVHVCYNRNFISCHSQHKAETPRDSNLSLQAAEGHQGVGCAGLKRTAVARLIPGAE